MLNEARSGGMVGSGSLAVGAGASDSVRQAIQNRDIRSISDMYAEKLKELTDVTVSIDGAFFDDGSFVGADDSNFFAQFSAQQSAKKDLYAQVLSLTASNESTTQVESYLLTLAGGQTQVASPRSSPTDHYNYHKAVYAAELSRILKTQGENGVVNFVESELSKSKPSLRKL